MSISAISSNNIMYRLIVKLLDQVQQNSTVVNQAAEANRQNPEIAVETVSEGRIDVRA
jgi:hypothetical protein